MTRCSRSLLTIVSICALLGMLVSPTDAQQGVSVAAIEVTQGQQADPRIGCPSPFTPIDPLIVKRRTGVRVYVTKQDSGPVTVEGYLLVRRAGNLVWSGRSLNQLSVTQSIACAIDRNTELSTINFEIPYKKLTIGIYQIEAWVFPVGQTPNPFASGTVGATAVNRSPPRILALPVRYLPATPPEHTVKWRVIKHTSVRVNVTQCRVA